jgi:acetoin utilization deacetylase AcuC-like enzyme
MNLLEWTLPTTAVFWNPDIFLHDLHANHAAMDAERIATVARTVLARENVEPLLAQPATAEQLERAHHPDYLEYLASSASLPEGKSIALALDTEMNRHTWRAMQLSAGAACQAVDAVRDGSIRHAFNPVYAGHHADHYGGDGFCFINTVLVGALHAQARGFERIAVLDFDVHSGNGTVMGLLDKPEFRFAETYQPGYPGAFMQKINRPEHILRRKCESRADVLTAWTGFFATLKAWRPDLVMVSAGFDAHRADPLGRLGLVDADYEWLAKGLLSLDAPIVASLEGGYTVTVTARCAALFTNTLAQG